jgi:hypothetical protein
MSGAGGQFWVLGYRYFVINEALRRGGMRSYIFEENHQKDARITS